MRAVSRLLAIAVSAAAASACEPRKCGHVCNSRSGDPRMESAYSRAQPSVDVLLHELEHPSPTRTYAAAKVRVSGPHLGEHIWLDDTRFERGSITGTLSEDATGLPEFKQGMEIRVVPTRVSDWMTIDQGRMCGGFTLRVDWPRMEQAEKDFFLREYGVARVPLGDEVCDTAVPAATKK